MPSWGHIWAAGRAKEAGDRLPLVRLIQAIDAAGRSETGERKAVDLMLNSGWSVEDTMNRMGKTYTGSHDDVNVEEFHTPPPMNPERSDDEDDDRWRSNIEASEPMALNTGWEIVKTQIDRVKSPSPDAKAGSQKCRECDNQGGALPCKSCGYMKTPTGKQRQTKPSQRNNKNYQILRSDIEKKKMKWGYKSDRGQKPAPKLPTPKKDKNKIK